MLHKYLKVLLIIAIVSSFITHTIAIDSKNFVIARMTFSDIFGLASVILFLIIVLKRKMEFLKWLYELKYPLILILGLASSVFLSLNVKSTIVEVLIVGYLIVFSGLIIYTFKDHLITLFSVLIFTLFVTTFIGIYDLLARNFELPVFFESATKNIGVSGFRYFGQAANYSFTFLTLLIPLRYSNFYDKLPVISKKLLPFSVVLGVLFLFSTGRISIILSFILGMALYLLLNRNKINIGHVVFFFGGSFIAIIFTKYFMSEVYLNLIYRLQSRVTNRILGTPEADFIITNFKDSLHAFIDNPISGSGLGAFVNNYSKFEIHGTYLKMLGETGLIGMMGYIIFLGSFLYMIQKIATNKKNVNKSYIVQMIPFIFASLISWSYNYHLRKKEFWILYAIVSILYLNLERNKIQEKELLKKGFLKKSLENEWQCLKDS